jgi:hypothetical protein
VGSGQGYKMRLLEKCGVDYTGLMKYFLSKALFSAVNDWDCCKMVLNVLMHVNYADHYMEAVLDKSFNLREWR